eukprot:COSAG01_NODE_5560_length_4185_cov_2.404307_2_plen_545_part_00
MRAFCSNPPVRLGRAKESLVATADISSRDCCFSIGWPGWPTRPPRDAVESGGSTEFLLEMHELSKSGDGGSTSNAEEKSWQLVNVSVTSPADSVSGRGQGRCARHQWQAAALTALVAGVMLTVLVMLNVGKTTCAPVTIANGRTHGACSGTQLGYKCYYSGCDPGYFLAGLGEGAVTYNGSVKAEHSDQLPTHPVCRQCSGAGIFCEFASGRCVPTPVSQTANSTCTAEGGVLCQPQTAEPVCTVCHEPAWDSAWHACELSGHPWGADPAPAAESHAVRCVSPRLGPSICLDNRKSGQVPGSQEWLDAGQTLASGASQSSIKDLQRGSSCQLRALADCGSPRQRAYIQAGPQWQFRRCVVPRKHPSTQAAQLIPGRGPTPLPEPWQHVVPQVPLTPPQLLWSHVADVNTTDARTCRSRDGRAAYDGTPMQCVEYFCPAITVSAKSLSRCLDCGSIYAYLNFPRTSAVHTAPTTVPCSGPHSGNISLLCGVGGWKVHSGSCRRKTCPRDVVDLTGLFWGRLFDRVITVPCTPFACVCLIQLCLGC